MPKGGLQCASTEQTGVNLEIPDVQNIQKQASFAGNDAANDDGDIASISRNRSSSPPAMRAMTSQETIDSSEESSHRARLISQRRSKHDRYLKINDDTTDDFIVDDDDGIDEDGSYEEHLDLLEEVASSDDQLYDTQRINEKKRKNRTKKCDMVRSKRQYNEEKLDSADKSTPECSIWGECMEGCCQKNISASIKTAISWSTTGKVTLVEGTHIIYGVMLSEVELCRRHWRMLLDNLNLASASDEILGQRAFNLLRRLGDIADFVASDDCKDWFKR